MISERMVLSNSVLTIRNFMGESKRVQPARPKVILVKTSLFHCEYIN